MECVGCQKTERRLAFSGDKKPGNFYSDPWTARLGGGMMVGQRMSARSISSSSAMDLVAGVRISVINGLLAALALGLASARLC
jgi:hypothetical protein